MADQVKDQAKDTAQEVVERGQEVAQQAAQSAKETAQQAGREHAEGLNDSAPQKAQRLATKPAQPPDAERPAGLPKAPAGRPTADAVGKPTRLGRVPACGRRGYRHNARPEPYERTGVAEHTEHTAAPRCPRGHAGVPASSLSRANNRAAPQPVPRGPRPHSAALDASRDASRYCEYPNPAAPTRSHPSNRRGHRLWQWRTRRTRCTRMPSA